jgi:hypothetical protein
MILRGGKWRALRASHAGEDCDKSEHLHDSSTLQKFRLSYREKKVLFNPGK